MDRGSGDNTVSVISERTNKVTAAIPVGVARGDVTVDPATGIAYVTDNLTWAAAAVVPLTSVRKPRGRISGVSRHACRHGRSDAA